MKIAKLCSASINALVSGGFIDSTYYRYILRYYDSDGDIVASRYPIRVALFGGDPKIETVRVIPR